MQTAGAMQDDVGELARVLEAGIVDLVRAAPDLAPADVEAAAQRALELALALLANGPAVALALAIERALDGIADGKIAQGVGLPALAMAAYTLWRGVVEPAQVPPMEASRFELETLFPIVGRAQPGGAGVDVALDRLSPTLAAAGTSAMRARAQRLGALALGDQLEVDLEALAAMRGRYDVPAG
jgi:hypothetical protein